jgi:multiple sugar transport system permease protein
VPGIVLAIPQYLLLAKLGLAGTYWSVLLPSVINPFGIFLCRVFAQTAVSTENLEAARIDGGGEVRIFTTIVLPMMTQGLVTVFLLQFVGIWNNFLLPFIMLSDQDKYPMTLGLYSFLAKGAGDTGLYPFIIVGSAISILPLMALLLVLQRFWRADLLAGGLKG